MSIAFKLKYNKKKWSQSNNQAKHSNVYYTGYLKNIHKLGTNFDGK